jgi:hypothetical protein
MEIPLCNVIEVLQVKAADASLFFGVSHVLAVGRSSSLCCYKTSPKAISTQWLG